jgi:nitrile hydratase accessory protein
LTERDHSFRPPGPEGHVFAEPWEAQVFALAVNLHDGGAFTWPEWAETLGKALRDAPDRPYYESWLAALETIVERKGLMTQVERNIRVDAWDRAARSTPHGRPIELKT